jgi:hypothetical protein
MAEVKKFNETKIGAFLASKAPKVLQALGKAVDKEQAMKLIEQDLQELKEVSSRWRADMKSDSWLSKNTRPLALVFLTVSAIFMMAVDSFHLQFDVDESWVNTVYVAYFGSRGAEKITKINK